MQAAYAGLGVTEINDDSSTGFFLTHIPLAFLGLTTVCCILIILVVYRNYRLMAGFDNRWFKMMSLTNDADNVDSSSGPTSNPSSHASCTLCMWNAL